MKRTVKFLVVSQKTDWEKVHYESFSYEQAEAYAMEYHGPEPMVWLKKVFVWEGSENPAESGSEL